MRTLKRNSGGSHEVIGGSIPLAAFHCMLKPIPTFQYPKNLKIQDKTNKVWLHMFP